MNLWVQRINTHPSVNSYVRNPPQVRLVPGKAGISFVEFENEQQSSVAMNGLQDFKITPTNLMKITFAKR